MFSKANTNFENYTIYVWVVELKTKKDRQVKHMQRAKMKKKKQKGLHVRVYGSVTVEDS